MIIKGLTLIKVTCHSLGEINREKRVKGIKTESRLICDSDNSVGEDTELLVALFIPYLEVWNVKASAKIVHGKRGITNSQLTEEYTWI